MDEIRIIKRHIDSAAQNAALAAPDAINKP